MTASRSFARTWTVDCLHCQQPFEQVGKRGKLRRTCSDECQAARLKFRRCEVRRGRYQALVDAGAFPAVAKIGCEGPKAFEAVMAAIKAGDPAPLGIARPERRKPVGRLRDICKAPKAVGGFNRWRRRAA